MDKNSEKLISALTESRMPRRAATAAKEKLKDNDEDYEGVKRRRVEADDSDEDPDFDQEAANKDKKKEKEKERAKKEEKVPKGAGRPRASVGGRKRPLGHNVKCPFCDEGFSKVEVVMEHIMAIHELEKRYTCKLCAQNEPGSMTQFPFFSNVEDHMVKLHTLKWSKRDKFDPVDIKPFNFRVRQAAKYCVVPKENPTFKEDQPKARIPRSYSNSGKCDKGKPSPKVNCPECNQVFHNDDPRVLIDHIMTIHLEKSRYYCSKCGPALPIKTFNEFHTHLKEVHAMSFSACSDAGTEVYMICKRIPKEIKKQLALTEDDVEGIETMGRGCDDEQEEEEEEEELIIDGKWQVFIQGYRILYRCKHCAIDVEGRSAVVAHNTERHSG